MNSTNGVYGLFIGLFALAITGCSTVAPNYSPSIDNVEAIKAAGIQKANVGSITETPQLNKISLRGSSMTSPISGSYGAYLADVTLPL